MTAATTSVVAATSAARARRVRDVLDAFRIADATAPDRARTLESMGTTLGPEIEMLAGAGILVNDPKAGTWWLSERAYIAHRDQQPKKAIRILLVLVAISLFIVAIGMFALLAER